MSTTEDPQSAPFQRLTADNHGPAVIVASYIFLVTAIIVVFTRLVTRLRVARKFAMDDYLITASITFCIAQTVAVTIASNNGLGQHGDKLSNSQYTTYLKAIFAARVLTIPTLACAKSSTNLLIMGIHPPKPIMLACKITLAIINVWALAAMLAIIFECKIPEVWSYQTQCVNQWALYLSNVAWNVLTDVALILLPFFLMRNVQVSAQKRWVVVGLFGFRIIVPAFAIAGAVTTWNYWNASPADPTWHAVKGTLWTQGVINMSIIAACIPCIKRFLADLSSGMMAVNISEPLELTMKNMSSSGGDDKQMINAKSRNQSFLGSKIFKSNNVRSQHRSHLSRDLDEGKGYQHEPKTNPQFTPQNNSSNTKVMVERSDSKKRLKEGIILQTIDYDVRREERESDVWEGSQTSNRVDSRTSQD